MIAFIIPIANPKLIIDFQSVKSQFKLTLKSLNSQISDDVAVIVTSNEKFSFDSNGPLCDWNIVDIPTLSSSKKERQIFLGQSI